MRGLQGKAHLPTFCAPVALAGALTAADVILHLLGRKRPVCVPRVKWIDLFEQRMEVIDTRRRRAPRLPTIFKAVRAWLSEGRRNRKDRKRKDAARVG
jgi:hypothetical protein